MTGMIGKSSSTPHGSTTLMIYLSGYTKGMIASEYQAALNNFKKGTKTDASAYPIFKNDVFCDTFQRFFLATIKTQGLCDIAYPDLDPYDGDQYDQQLFEGKVFYIFCIGYFTPDRQGKRATQGV